MTRLYTTPLPKSQATTSDDGIRAQIQQSGLLEQGGTATEAIATENIDLLISGQFRLGARFSKKLADELESVAESTYSGLPVYDPNIVGGGRNAGYYEVEQVDVSPVQNATEETYEYEVSFSSTGTHEEHWRAVDTNKESVGSGLATGSNSLIAIPDTASKVRWYGESAGKENASRSSAVAGEFARVALYDPADTSISDPILLYETPYDSESPVDVRVYDDRDREKYYTQDSSEATVSTDTHVGSATVGGTVVSASQWTHAYHTSYEFEGDPVVDNGLLRLRYDEPGGVVEAYEWNNSNQSWDALSVSHTNFKLIDADFERIGPSDTRAYVEFQNKNDDSLRQAILSVQRGLTRVLAREPDNDTWTSAFESYLGQFCGDYTTDNNPAQGLEARGEVK